MTHKELLAFVNLHGNMIVKRRPVYEAEIVTEIGLSRSGSVVRTKGTTFKWTVSLGRKVLEIEVDNLRWHVTGSTEDLPWSLRHRKVCRSFHPLVVGLLFSLPTDSCKSVDVTICGFDGEPDDEPDTSFWLSFPVKDEAAIAEVLQLIYEPNSDYLADWISEYCPNPLDFINGIRPRK